MNAIGPSPLLRPITQSWYRRPLRITATLGPAASTLCMQTPNATPLLSSSSSSAPTTATPTAACATSSPSSSTTPTTTPTMPAITRTTPAPTRPMCVLAPMVRTGELPTRLVSLKYGADLVWGPEIVDKAIIGATRVENTAISCIDFVKPSNNRPNDIPKSVFRTHPGLERKQLIFQLGSASAELAVQAAKVVAKDVAGIDLNCGCPKHFSIHSGMGAALLQAPDRLCEILTSLVREVGPGTEYNVPISVKIRLLEPHMKTLGLVERLAKTGVCRVTVHTRTTPMRPREPAIRDPEVIMGLARICRENGVAIFMNGDVSCREDAERLCEMYGLDGCMIARAAESNPSCFKGGKGEIGHWRDVAREILQTAMEVDNNFSNTKFLLSHVIEGKNAMYNLVTRSKTYGEMCGHLEVPLVMGLTDEEGTAKGKGKVAVGGEGARGEKAKTPVENAKVGGNSSAVAAGAGKSVRKEKRKLSERGVGGSGGGEARGGGREDQAGTRRENSRSRSRSRSRSPVSHVANAGDGVAEGVPVPVAALNVDMELTGAGTGVHGGAC